MQFPKFEDLNLVQVQFESRNTPGMYTGKPFSYIADVPLKEGDIVKAPTKYGDRQARVFRVNVPLNEIQCRAGELRHITEAVPSGNLFTGFM